MSVKVTGVSQVVRKFGAAPETARGRLTDAIGRAALNLRRRISATKLAGQVLKMRTGTLTRSIDWSVVSDDRSIVGLVFTNVEYAARHEYGFSGTENVKEHLRLVKKAFGRELKSPVWSRVGPHTRKIEYPARSFMRTALADMEAEIVSDMSAAVSGAFK